MSTRRCPYVVEYRPDADSPWREIMLDDTSPIGVVMAHPTMTAVLVPGGAQYRRPARFTKDTK